jgi:16S rRNA (cytidine1402-2'-O)-methyltransferase
MGEREGAAAERPAAERQAGRLVICPTPIGNLGDMTQRTIDALASADVVCAEDTRVTGKLLVALGLSRRLERLDENMIGERADGIVGRVLAGEVIAYCSDAGMPGVSDPGLRLVAAARAAGAAVEVLPGPSAAATAYVASGCTNPRFYFGGFFPRKDAARREVLASLAGLDAALIFYESPRRVAGALRAIAEAFPDRQLSVCRELTKLHEEVVRGVSTEVADEFARRDRADGIRGEIVLVIDGVTSAERAADERERAADADVRAGELARQGLRGKQIARQLADEFGIPRNEAYERALEAVRQAREQTAGDHGGETAAAAAAAPLHEEAAGEGSDGAA